MSLSGQWDHHYSSRCNAHAFSHSLKGLYRKISDFKMPAFFVTVLHISIILFPKNFGFYKLNVLRHRANPLKKGFIFNVLLLNPETCNYE
jgi:hypothetical protein